MVTDEFYYKSRIADKIKEFFEEESDNLCQDNYGWIAPEIESRMVEAAFQVLAYGKNVQDFLRSEDLLKD